MPIYAWEQSLSAWCKSLPRTGFLFDFMFFFSHPGLIGTFIGICLVFLRYRKKIYEAILLLVFSSVAIATMELISMKVLKSSFLRQGPDNLGRVCDGPKCLGFISFYAMNVGTIVSLFIWCDRKNAAWGLPLLLLTCISGVYLVEYYPIDVIYSSFLGGSIGSVYWVIYNQFVLKRMTQS